MDTLFVNPVNPVAFGALNTDLAAIQAVARRPTTHGKVSGTPALTIQDLAQSLFQQSLQTTTLRPQTEPTSGSAGLAQDAVIALLAALHPAQAPTDATQPVTPPTNPVVVQAVDTSATTAATSAAPSTVPATNPQDGFGTSLDPDFAMQTALRFGAGVTIPAAASTSLSNRGGAGMVRDASAVLQMGNLQPHAGSPGPEAFAHPQATAHGIFQTYETTPALPPAQVAGTVDLIA